MYAANGMSFSTIEKKAAPVQKAAPVEEKKQEQK
jgi:hypothetical protein